MYKSIIVFGLALFSFHAMADQLSELQSSELQLAKHQLDKQQTPEKSALVRQETVVYLNAEHTASILGDQADLNGDLAYSSGTSSSGDALPANEAVIYIASQHAENLLGDNTADSLAIESLNSMPATAAGIPTAIGNMGNPEEVIYISPSLLELILGND